MSELIFFSNVLIPNYSNYLDVKIINSYDISHVERERHDKYMEEYRKYLLKVCYLASQYNERSGRCIVNEYVNLTVNNQYREKPKKVYALIKTQLKILISIDIKGEIVLYPNLSDVYKWKYYECSCPYKKSVCKHEVKCRNLIWSNRDRVTNPNGLLCPDCYIRKRKKRKYDSEKQVYSKYCQGCLDEPLISIIERELDELKKGREERFDKMRMEDVMRRIRGDI